MQAKLKEKIEYEDLDKDAGNSSSDGPALRLTHMDRYLHGPTPVQATQYHTSADILLACQAVTQEMMAWSPKLPQVSGNFLPQLDKNRESGIFRCYFMA